ncbi:MAG: PAS domain S-box protein, partial [Chloroflexota bacterium]|nr:PAS domain S-box protein [Chloroflexota bacterium]
MDIALHVLLLEDRPADAELVLHELRRAGYAPVWQRVETEAAYLAALDPALDLILADYALPQFDALRALDLLQARGLDIPFIIVSGTIGEEVAVAAMRQGAADYLIKDRLARLGQAVATALAQRRLRVDMQRAEAALHASARLHQAVLHALTAEIAVLDPAGTIIAVNAAWEHFARTHGDPLLTATGIGVNYLDVCRRAADHGHDTEAAHTLASLRALIDGHQSHFTLEYGCQTPTEVRWYSMQATPLPDHDGVVVAHEDISERKRAEQAQHAAETNYRTLVEHIPAIVYRAAIDATSSTLYVNPQIETMLGFSQAEWLADPQRWLTQLHPGDLAQVLAGVTRAHAGDTTLHSEFRMLARDGHEVWFRDEAVVVRDAVGQPRFLQGVMLDITERKRAELAMARAAERLRVLADASRAFAEVSVEYQVVLDRIAQTTAAVLGGGCAIAMRSDDGMWLNQVAQYDVDPAMRALLSSATVAVMPLHATVMAGQIMRTNQAIMIPVLDLAQAPATTGSEYVALM